MQEIAHQVAALPLRRDKEGRLRVLLVTSRDTGRWVLPKGWPISGKKPWRAAEIEALEEAGAEGEILRKAIGTYHYGKRLEDGTSRHCRVSLYPLAVAKLRRRWKERGERKRHWCSPKRAAELVEEPDLAALLEALEETIADNPGLARWLKGK